MNVWSYMSSDSIPSWHGVKPLEPNIKCMCHAVSRTNIKHQIKVTVFLKQKSFKFWYSLAFTVHLVQAANSYAQGELYLYLALFRLLIFKQLHWLGRWCTLMQTLVQVVSVLLWPMFYSGTCFTHLLYSEHTNLLTCFLSRSRVTKFSLQ